MASLTKLPRESMHNICAYLDPISVSQLSQSCKLFHLFISHNAPLHKDLYLHLWDAPCYRCEDAGATFWEEEVHRLAKLQKTLESTSTKIKEEALTETCDALINLVESIRGPEAESKNLAFLKKHMDPDNVVAFMTHSDMFRRANIDERYLRRSLTARQASAKLHCLYGIPLDSMERSSKKVPSTIPKTYPFACSIVYDLRNYTFRSMWGPFTEDGSCEIDWEKMEAICVVLGYNIRNAREALSAFYGNELWDTPFSGISPDSFIPTKLPHIFKDVTSVSRQVQCQIEDAPSLDPADDPYGISGTWLRVVCFVDYTELFEYNFAHHPPARGQPREPLATREATRLILMHLKATKSELPAENDPDNAWRADPTINKKLRDSPVVHFIGSTRPSRSLWDPNAHALIKGTVQMTKWGDVRWTTFSVYQGEERWRSEGIQLGGHKSGRGVFGNWFDKDFDRHGPAGPTAFWKIDDGMIEADEASTPDAAASVAHLNAHLINYTNLFLQTLHHAGLEPAENT